LVGKSELIPAARWQFAGRVLCARHTYKSARDFKRIVDGRNGNDRHITFGAQRGEKLIPMRGEFGLQPFQDWRRPAALELSGRRDSKSEPRRAGLPEKAGGAHSSTSASSCF
jgi:hypothetical protein